MSWGPLSHVHPEKNRKKAIMELTRVAKKNAPIFISVMGKFGCVMTSPGRSVNEIAMDKHFREWSLKGEDYMWGSISMNAHGYSHYFTLDELKNLLPKNFIFIENIGLEGLASSDQNSINEMAEKNKKAWKNWLKMHYKLCTHPTVVDISMHFMIIGKRG